MRGLRNASIVVESERRLDGGIFPIGVSFVRFVYVIEGVNVTVLPVCSVRVHLVPGKAVPVSTIRYSDTIESRVAVVAAAGDLYSGVTRIAPLAYGITPDMEVLQSLRPQGELPFTINADQAGAQVQTALEVDVAFCQLGASLADVAWASGPVNLDALPAVPSGGSFPIVSVNASDSPAYGRLWVVLAGVSAEQPEPDVSLAALSPGRGCLRLTLRQALQLSAGRLTHGAIHLIAIFGDAERAALAGREVASPLHLPQPGSSVRYIFRNAAAPAAAAVSVRDDEPPRWLNCPVEPLRFVVAAPAAGKVLNWLVPEAVDNVGVVSVRASDEPPLFVSLEEGKRAVIYVAEDAAGNTASCRLRLTVEYTGWNTLTLPMPVNTDLKHSVYRGVDGGILSQISVLGPEDATAALEEPRRVFAGQNRILLALRPPPETLFRLDVSDVSTVLAVELDVGLRLRNGSVVPLPQVDTFVQPYSSVRLVNATDATGAIPSAEQLAVGPSGTLASFTSEAASAWSETSLRIFGTGAAPALSTGIDFLGIDVLLSAPTGTGLASDSLVDLTVLRCFVGFRRRGNLTASHWLSVVNRDVTPPALSCPPDVDRQVPAGVFGVTLLPEDVAVTATDPAGVTILDVPGVDYDLGTTTVTVRAVDGVGNEASCTFDVYVRAATSEAAKSSSTLDSKGWTGIGIALSMTMVLLVLLALYQQRRRKGAACVYNFANHLQELSLHLRDKDGLKIPHEVKRSAISALEVRGHRLAV